ncbi:MAG TPA: DUF3108 domain-containing protein [Opitutaceae bacterium]|nr:DUF3108 domain-containing protein [Opitutaceae bacterium]
MLRLPVLLLAALLPTFAAASDASFLRPGERLELRLGYGWFGTAGLTTIETVREEHADGARLRIHVATESRGLVDTLYPVANDSESVLDAATGRPLTLTTKGKNGRRLTEKTTTFDYAAGQAVHVNAIRPQHSATVALPPEPAYDLMVALLQTRDWRLKVGESRRIDCVNDKDFFTLEVTAIAEDRVKTPTGTFDAVVLEPKPVGTPVGFFKKGGALKVWVSRGDRPQIVRLDTKTKIGTVTALLAREETIQPTAAATAAPVAAETARP